MIKKIFNNGLAAVPYKMISSIRTLYCFTTKNSITRYNMYFKV